MAGTWVDKARRCGPFLAVSALLVMALSCQSGDDNDEGQSDAASSNSEDESTGVDEEQLTRDGPMTPQKAELLSEEDVDFGPDCDPATGRIRLPSVYAPQCVVPFTGDNGGATGPGVTDEEILLVRYIGNRSQNEVDTSAVDEQITQEYIDLYQEIFETYGRTVRVETFAATGADDDAAVARADAQAIVALEPFAVIDGPLQQAPVFASELAANGVLCLGFCAVTVPEQVIVSGAPYIWPAGPTANQAAALAAEMIGSLAGPGPAEFAGDPELQGRDRVYAVVHYNTEDGAHTPVYEAMRDGLAEHDIELATDVEFELDLLQQEEIGRTIVDQLVAAEVTTVIFYGDFITPAALTKAATAQGYSPEWILGPNLMADTPAFARGFDQQQWGNGFGIAITPAGGAPQTIDAYHVYEWAYGTAPPAPDFARHEVGLRLLFIGLHLAGPELTPESFQDGLFRFVPSGGSPTAPLVSRGSDGVWEQIDYGGFDDAGILWWDADAQLTEATGETAVGFYRYANGGQRYGPGEFPESPDEAGLFDEGSSITRFEELPAEDRPPTYPSPDG